MKKFSIIVPIYWNELNIPHTVPRLQNIADSLKKFETEFIFVDDGSGDKSLEVLLRLRNSDHRIKIVILSKNFGSMQAITAGLSYASGDCVGIITADMQDPPELFTEMISRWEEGNKVVMAVRSVREESWSQKFFASMFYRLMARFAIPNYPNGGFDFVVLDKQVVSEIISIKEKNTNVFSLILWLGHKRESIAYVRQKREYGKSCWTFSKKVKLFIDSFVAFSYAPIRIISFIGLTTAVASFIFGIFVIINAIFGRIPVQGYTTIVSIITFLLGLVMFMLGIIGEYLWRVLDEVRKRPPFIVDTVYGFEREGKDKS